MITEREVADKCMCSKVRCAARAVTRVYDTSMRPSGLRATQMSVLVAIAAVGAMSITALAEYLGMDRSTLTRNLRPLENNGLVSLGSEGWRRSRTLSITKKGAERLRKAMPYWERAQKKLRDALGVTNWSDAVRSLDHLGRIS